MQALSPQGKLVQAIPDLTYPLTPAETLNHFLAPSPKSELNDIVCHQQRQQYRSTQVHDRCRIPFQILRPLLWHTISFNSLFGPAISFNSDVVFRFRKGDFVIAATLLGWVDASAHSTIKNSLTNSQSALVGHIISFRDAVVASFGNHETPVRCILSSGMP
jgi:hypothetical protein